MSVEPRILVYEGRRFLRPETGPKDVGAKETGFGNLTRLAIVSALTAVFMIGGGVWFSGKIRSGEIPLGSPLTYLIFVIVLGPMFILLGWALVSARKKPAEKPEIPANPVVLLSTLVSQSGKTTHGGSLELDKGLIRVVGEKQTVEINRLEVESVKIVEGRVRLVIPKFHALPAIHIYLCPVNEELGNMMVRREVLKDLASRIEKMPTSALPSTYSRIEFREFQRPPGTLAKCILGGGVAGLAVAALARLVGRPDLQPAGSEPFFWLAISACFATLVSVMAFGDVWIAKSNNKWLQKKGIVRN